jgi:hypothetical protein
MKFHFWPVFMNKFIYGTSQIIFLRTYEIEQFGKVRQDWCMVAQLGKTGGTACKVSCSLTRATRRSWVQAPAGILTRLGNKNLPKSLMMLAFHCASVFDKPQWACITNVRLNLSQDAWVRFPTGARTPICSGPPLNSVNGETYLHSGVWEVEFTTGSTFLSGIKWWQSQLSDQIALEN